MTTLPFVKMHGIGNDYVYVDGFSHDVADPATLAVAIADRHRGVGGDGLILVLPPEPGVAADVRMRMFNADGSESEMCGNGIRCVAKFALDRGLTGGRGSCSSVRGISQEGDADAPVLRVQTGRGILTIVCELDDAGLVRAASVEMGEPIFEAGRIPVEVATLESWDPSSNRGILSLGGRDSFTEDSLSTRYVATILSMGNPHAVIHLDGSGGRAGSGDGVAAIDLERIGPRLERHPAFPKRVNVHFVEVHSPNEVTLRTWERGSGITQACGTGAAAVCVAGVLAGRSDREILAHLPGGDLELIWRGDGQVVMTGPAIEVFSGTWPLAPVARSEELASTRA